MASFLRRNEDLRRLRARQMVLQYETGFYPTQDTVLRFVDALGNIGESGVLIDNSGNLIVTGSADVSGDLSVGGDLSVDGSGGFGGDLYVDGTLNVDGSLDLSGDLYVYGLVSASGDVVSNSGLSRLSINNTGVGSCVVYSNRADEIGPQFQSFKSRGDTGAVQTDDELGRVNFFGKDSSGNYSSAGVGIRAFAAGNFVPGSHPSELRLATCPLGGTTAHDRVFIHDSGSTQFVHDSETAVDNHMERRLEDPCSGKILYTRDYVVGANYVGDFAAPYRDYRYVDWNLGNLPVWGIINDPSGNVTGDGAVGDIEIYNNVSVGAGSQIDANSAITIGGATGRSMHRVFQDGSYNALITHVAAGTGNVGYRLDSVYYDNGSELTYGANLLLNSDTRVDAGIVGNVGIGTSTPQAALDVSGSAYIRGNMYVGSDISTNEIRFHGTTDDDIGLYTNTLISERIYAPTEKSELLLFKGNDPNSTLGPDRIRLKGGEVVFQTYSAATVNAYAEGDYTTKMKADGNLYVGSSLKVGDLTTTPTATVDVSGSIRASGLIYSPVAGLYASGTVNLGAGGNIINIPVPGLTSTGIVLVSYASDAWSSGGSRGLLYARAGYPSTGSCDIVTQFATGPVSINYFVIKLS